MRKHDKQRLRDKELVGHLYRNKFIRWNNCVYCGDLATQRDHVFPLSLAARTDWNKPGLRELYFKVLITVPACAECNQLARDIGYTSFFDKRRAIKQKIRDRYKKLLISPLWSDQELEELDYNLRIKIKSAQAVSLHVYQRLQYPRGRDRETRQISVVVPAFKKEIEVEDEMPRGKFKIESIGLKPHEHDPKVGGVYMIECMVNGKKYIGASVQLKYRFAQHKSKLDKGTHPNLALQKDWWKHGPDQFQFTVLEYCKYMLWEKETKYNMAVAESKRYSHIDRNRAKKKLAAKLKGDLQGTKRYNIKIVKGK